MIKEVKELLIQELSKNMSSPENQDKIKKISSAKSWGELGISVEDGIKLLKEYGMKVVLNEADKIITENPRDYSSWDSLIGIHMTNYVPRNENIYTPQATERKRNLAFFYSSELYEIPIVSSRNTIHMVINNEVKDIDNIFGSMNWNCCKYAVLIPLKSISREQIKSGNPIDTFVEGNLQLNEQCWVICPSTEEENLRMNNPNINILGYNGESVRGYAAAFASALGYRVEPHDNIKWEDKISADSYSELMKNELFRTDLLHADTPEGTQESVRVRASIIVSICKAIKDNNIIKSKEDIPEFMSRLHEERNGIFQISDEEIERKVDEYIKKNESEQVYAGELVGRLYDDHIHTSLKSIPYAYEMLEKEGIYISEVHKKWIEIFLEKYPFMHKSKGLNVESISELVKSDEDKKFVEGMKEVCSKVCTSTSILRRHIVIIDAVLLYILLEDMMESRDKENDFGNKEFIESLSGQVIPEMADVQLADETQSAIISQERQIENTKDKQRS